MLLFFKAFKSNCLIKSLVNITPLVSYTSSILKKTFSSRSYLVFSENMVADDGIPKCTIPILETFKSGLLKILECMF